MKKLAITIAIVLGLGMTSFADPNGGGLFQRGEAVENNGIYGNNRDGFPPILPNHHDPTAPGGGTPGGDVSAPLGSGIALLTALGAAYLVGKRKREE